MRSLAAVLFDIDGTLVDSNDFHVHAWHAAFARQSREIPQRVIHEQIGKGGDQLIPTLAPDAAPQEREATSHAHDEIFKSLYLHAVQPFAGATLCIEALYRDGIHIVLASSARRAEVDHYVRLLNIASYLDAATCADDVQHSKPAGDIFAAALAAVAPLSATQALVVGDTPYDVIAANRCGIRAVALRSGGFTDAVLYAAGACAILDSVADLSTTTLRALAQ